LRDKVVNSSVFAVKIFNLCNNINTYMGNDLNGVQGTGLANKRPRDLTAIEKPLLYGRGYFIKRKGATDRLAAPLAS
jgi:hypothetical protein